MVSPYTAAVILALTVLVGVSSFCLEQWEESLHSGTCIRLFEDVKSWHEARATCKSLGGDLVRILNSGMNQFIYKQIAPIRMFPAYWLGLCGASDGEFRWLDDSNEPHYTNWKSGQPVLYSSYTNWYWRSGQPVLDSSPNNTCTEMFVLASGKWQTSRAESHHGYVCEKPAECDPGYYGEGCTNFCSEHCAGRNNSCHHINGTCDLGCETGYHGGLCTDECDPGYYGEGCMMTCSDHCAGDNTTCHHVNGTCDQGCLPGYHGELCLEAIPEEETAEVFDQNTVACVLTVMVVLTAAVAVAVIVHAHRQKTTKTWCSSCQVQSYVSFK